jgi:hypothetical protein
LGDRESETTWDEIERRVARLLILRHSAQAEGLLTQFLDTGAEGSPRRRALAYRAMAREHQGNLAAGRADLFASLDLCERATYERYVTQIGLGANYEAENDPGNATEWYRRALVTTVEADDVTAGTALRGILRSAGDDLDPSLSELCRAACRRSWEVLRLAGLPPDDLHACTDAILRAARRPPET